MLGGLAKEEADLLQGLGEGVFGGHPCSDMVYGLWGHNYRPIGSSWMVGSDKNVVVNSFQQLRLLGGSDDDASDPTLRVKVGPHTPVAWKKLYNCITLSDVSRYLRR